VVCLIIKSGKPEMIQLAEIFTREPKLKTKKSVPYVEQVNCEANKFLEAMTIISENEMDSWFQFFFCLH
jgi:hypothetical protein